MIGKRPSPMARKSAKYFIDNIAMQLLTIAPQPFQPIKAKVTKVIPNPKVNPRIRVKPTKISHPPENLTASVAESTGSQSATISTRLLGQLTGPLIAKSNLLSTKSYRIQRIRLSWIDTTLVKLERISGLSTRGLMKLLILKELHL